MNAYLIKYTLSKAAQTLFQKAISAVQPNKYDQILEPFSTVIKLAIISFKEDGTKIAVSENKLYIQPPSPLQGAIRTAYGHNREEVHYLLKPILRCIETHPAMSDNHVLMNPYILHIYQLAIEGLKRLKKNYGSGTSTVSHTIDLYINIMDTHINGGPKVIVDSYQSHSEEDPMEQSVYKLVDVEHLFNTLWDDSDFELISRMFRSAEQFRDTNSIEYYIDSITNMIKAKENHISDKLQKIQKYI